MRQLRQIAFSGLGVVVAAVLPAAAHAGAAKAAPTQVAPAKARTSQVQATAAVTRLPDGLKVAQALVALPGAQRGDSSAVVSAGTMALGKSSSLESLFGVLYEYQKSVAKEAREDAQLALAGRSASLNAKATKLAQQNSAIDEGMREAGQKAEIVTNAAFIAVVTAIAQGAIQIGAAGSTQGAITTACAPS